MSKTMKITISALFTAVLAILAQIQIPMQPVPFRRIPDRNCTSASLRIRFGTCLLNFRRLRRSYFHRNDRRSGGSFRSYRRLQNRIYFCCADSFCRSTYILQKFRQQDPLCYFRRSKYADRTDSMLSLRNNMVCNYIRCKAQLCHEGMRLSIHTI